MPRCAPGPRRARARHSDAVALDAAGRPRQRARMMSMTTKRDRKVTKRTAKVIPLAPRRRKVIDLVKFIDAHGGKLGAFRGYQVRPSTPPPAERA